MATSSTSRPMVDPGDRRPRAGAITAFAWAFASHASPVICRDASSRVSFDDLGGPAKRQPRRLGLPQACSGGCNIRPAAYAFIHGIGIFLPRPAPFSSTGSGRTPPGPSSRAARFARRLLKPFLRRIPATFAERAQRCRRRWLARISIRPANRAVSATTWQAEPFL